MMMGSAHLKEELLLGFSWAFLGASGGRLGSLQGLLGPFWALLGPLLWPMCGRRVYYVIFVCLNTRSNVFYVCFVTPNAES